jgi:septum formation protein
LKASRLVLASESARRVKLLHGAGYEFEARKSGFPELTLENPVQTVKANAKGKALAVVATDPDTIVLAADTIVYLPDVPAGDRILGQARNTQDVRRFIGLLQGRAHEVYTGVAVARGEDLASRHAVTSVRMRALDTAEVESYARYGEGVGKAGGYAVQGRAASFVEWICGDYTNVVGLPLALTIRMLTNTGIPRP